MSEKKPSVSVIGLGRLGYPLAACFVSKGYDVIGVDSNPWTVQTLNDGILPIHEPGLQDLLLRSKASFKAVLDIKQAVIESDISVVVVPTPSGPDGIFSNRHVLDVCDSIGNGLSKKSSHHTIALASTVMPGSTGGEIQRRLEKASGRIAGDNFGLCYVPAFVALGSVVRDFLNPDYVLIGECDRKSGDLLEELYGNVCENSPRVVRMNFVNAELTKLATNTFVSTKITFANMLAQFCELIPGAHVDTVTSALGMDTRIGDKYLKGGMAYGGPCLVRDNVALSAFAREKGSQASLSESTDKANHSETDRLVSLIKKVRKGCGVVGVLGITYKAGTDVIDDSPGIILVQALLNEDIPVKVYDPAAMTHARKVLGNTPVFMETAEACIQQSNIVVIATPWDEFSSLESVFCSSTDLRVIIDCWRVLEGIAIGEATSYIPLGRGPQLLEQ